MAGFNLQYHALPEENIALVSRFAQALPAFVTVQQNYPRLIRNEVVPDALRDLAKRLDRIDWLFMTLSEPRIVGLGLNDFVPANQDVLYIHIGNIEKGILRESQLATATENKTALEKWRTVANEVKRITRSGGWFIEPEGSAGEYVSTLRHTEGAFRAEEHGIRPGGVGGSSVFTFHQPLPRKKDN